MARLCFWYWRLIQICLQLERCPLRGMGDMIQTVAVLQSVRRASVVRGRAAGSSLVASTILLLLLALHCLILFIYRFSLKSVAQSVDKYPQVMWVGNGESTQTTQMDNKSLLQIARKGE